MPPVPKRLWQPEDDWSTFWPDMLIEDQFLNPEQHAKHREHMGIPPISIRPQGEPSGSQPTCSSCDRRPVICPDSVYRSWNPTQYLSR